MKITDKIGSRSIIKVKQSKGILYYYVNDTLSYCIGIEESLKRLRGDSQ